MPSHSRQTPSTTAAAATTETAPATTATPANSSVEVAILSGANLASAVTYNAGRRLPAAVWTQIGTVVGVAGTGPSPELVLAVARWQDRVGLDADGKVGQITMEWLSHEPGGEGLENNVTTETTLFMGLNPESKDIEFQQLRGQTNSPLIGALGSGQQHQDEIRVGNQWASLTQDEGLQQALSLLPGLPVDKGRQIIDFLRSSASNTRDEMFQMIQACWAAESGRGLLKRVVLSGHSNGSTLWGGHDAEFGSMSYSQIYRLFGLFPRAASQVEDVAFSACFSGMTGGMEQYRSVFPNAKSFWGYADYSPSAATGSLRHLSQWERGSRGHDASNVEEARTNVARGSGPRDQNVATWTEEGGYQTNVGRANLSLEDLRTAVESRRPAYDAAYTLGNINQTSLDALQGDLQTLVRMHGDSLGAARESYSLMNIRTLYLRHWSTITAGFEERYGADMREGFTEAGIELPEFSKLNRATVLRIVRSFTATGAKSTEAKRLLEEVLRDLDPEQVPYGRGNIQ